MDDKRIIKIGDMTIDKKRDLKRIWYENDKGEIVEPTNDAEDLCLSADANIINNVSYYHVCNPLEVTEEVYAFNPNPKEGEAKFTPIMNINCSIGSDDLVIAMVESGDFSLSEALHTVSIACERCINVLRNRYLPMGIDSGYQLYSKEWKDVNTSCCFCEHLKAPVVKKSQPKTRTLSDMFNEFVNSVRKAFFGKTVPDETSNEFVNSVSNIYFETKLKFEYGKYYQHATGQKIHICGRAVSDIYYNPCLVAEDDCGNVIFVGEDETYAENFHEIRKEDFLPKEETMKEDLDFSPEEVIREKMTKDLSEKVDNDIKDSLGI